MKARLIILFIFWSLFVSAQNITTIASSGVYDPNGLVFDAYGNLYFTTLLGNQVKKMDTSGLITIVAGTGSAGFYGDGGPAINAQLNQPCGITVDTLGNIFFADIMNQRIRKIDVSTGIISSIAGIGPGGYTTGAFSGDSGLAIVAALNNPTSVCFDDIGNLYIADALNRRIRKINTSGVISTIAGNGVYGSSGDDGPAILAECSPNGDIHVDEVGNIYFTENGSIINKVRKINPMGIISKIAGDTSSYIYNGDDIPATAAYLNPGFITFDFDGYIYISDAYNNRVRKIDGLGTIHTIAGNGIGGHSGDGFPATEAEIWHPSGLAFDKCGNLFVGEVGSPAYIRKVSFNPACWPEKISEIPTNNITVYPNPAYETINIDRVKTEATYRILNITGIIEQSGTLNQGNNSISISTLPAGVYVLEVVSLTPALSGGEGGIRAMYKVVKE